MNAGGIGRPHGEEYTLFSIFHGRMRTQFFVDIIVRSLCKHILVGLGNKYFLQRLLFYFFLRRLLLFFLPSG